MAISLVRKKDRIDKETKIAKERPIRFARSTGILYFLVILAGIICEVINQNIIIASSDLSATISNILSHGTIFRVSFVIALIRFIVFILLVISLQKIFRLVNPDLTLVMMVIAIIAIVIGMVSLLFNYAAPLLLSNPDYSAFFTTDQWHAQVWFFINLQKFSDKTTQILSIWLLPLAYLMYKSGFLPKVFGLLMGFAGFGYMIDFVIFILFPNLSWQISGFAFLMELPFPVWLLIKGLKKEDPIGDENQLTVETTDNLVTTSKGKGVVRLWVIG